jgi:hypothetical protein
MEGVEDTGGLRQAGAERGGIAAERVQRGHRDPVPPALVAVRNPAAQGLSTSAFHHVQQPRPAVESDDASREPGATGWGRGQERGLVHAEGVHPIEPGRVVDQRPAVVTDGGHYRRPAHPELRRDSGDCLPQLADPPASLPPRPLGPRRPRPDHLRSLRPSPLGAAWLDAAPHPLDPHQRHRPPRRGQIPHPTRPPVMQPGTNPAPRAPAHIGDGRHRLLDFTGVLRHGQHHEPGQPEHDRRRDTVTLHLGPP